MAHTTDPPSVAVALAKGRLGGPSVLFFLLSGVAPLTTSAAIISYYAVTGQAPPPLVFLAVPAILAIFAVGHVAMAARITNAGAFYAFVAKGIGRPAGVASASVAVVAYNLLQIALYGMFGPTLAQFMEGAFGVTVPWWVWSGVAWLATGILGVLDVRLSGVVLAVLCVAEIAVLVILSAFGVAHPAASAASVLVSDDLSTAGFGAAGVLAVLGFVGFEAGPLFSEEIKARRIVPIATYVSLATIALVYFGVAVALNTHYGEEVVTVAANSGPDMLFTLGGNGFMAAAARCLFVTSLFAAMIAFHNAVTRYTFSLGREAVLPAALGRTGVRSNAPWVASLTQSALGATAIAGYALADANPKVQLFYWAGLTGGFGVLVLLAVTSFAVIGYFLRNPQGESLWRRMIAPAVAATAMTLMIGLAIGHFQPMLGVAPGSVVAWLLPGVYVLAACIGMGWALYLRRARPHVYAVIGLGPDAVLARLAAPRWQSTPPEPADSGARFL